MSIESITTPYVEVSVEVEEDFEPDLISLYITFSDECTTKEECIRQYNNDLQAVLQALEDCGLPRKSIKQSYFRISPATETLYKKYEDKDRYYAAKEVITGVSYRGISKAEFDLDEKLFTKCWIALFKTEGKFTYEFSYGLKDESAAEDKLLAIAVKQANGRASILAKAADSKLGSVVKIVHKFQVKMYRRKSVEPLSLTSLDSDDYLDIVPDFSPEDVQVECSVIVVWGLLTD